MGIVGIILAVISLTLVFIPCIGFIGLLPAALALIFSIISIIQATNGYGSKGLGIGAMVVSLISIFLASVWLTFIGGGLAFINELENNPDRIEIFSKKLEKGLEDADIEIKIETDSMVKTLRSLESITDSSISKKDDAGKVKTARITIDTDSVRVHIEAKEKNKK